MPCRRVCNAWQLADACLCTVSLYTLCAVGLDRWLNIERPLRVRALHRPAAVTAPRVQVFTRSRGIAKRALALAWLVPIFTWTITYSLLMHRDGYDREWSRGDSVPPATGVERCRRLWHAPIVLLVGSRAPIVVSSERARRQRRR